MCVFITISGTIASKRGFYVSKELDEPLNYNIQNVNPILETVADQANQDPSGSHGHLRGLKLRDLIIDALNDNSLEWQRSFGHGVGHLEPPDTRS